MPMAPRANRIWLVVWILAAVVLVARATSRREAKGVILDHVEFGRRLWLGEDVYGPWRSDVDAPLAPLHPPYPPSFGLMTMPCALVAEVAGMRAARAMWALVQIGCLVWIARVLRDLLTGRAEHAPPAANDGRAANWHLIWLLGALLLLRFLLRDMHGGGGNVINLALCLAAFADAERGKPLRAGLLLGFSLATKPTQLWLLPMFAVFGRWRALGWTAATGFGCVLVTLALQRFDVAPWLRWIEGTWALATQSDAFADPALGFPKFEWMNQSLRCALARWLGEVPPEFAAKVAWGVPRGLGFVQATVAMVTRIVSVSLLALTLVVGWRARRNAMGRMWAFAGALVLSVLLSPLSWKAHHMALAPVVVLLVHRALQRRERWIWALFAGWVLCCQLGADLVGDAADEWGNSVYVVTAWDLALLVVAARLARWAVVEAGPPEPSAAGQPSAGAIR